MILVDYREKPGRRDKKELAQLIQQRGVPVDAKADLPYGDLAFEGNGPNGPISIGVERKRLHDMLACIDDSRYSAHQRIGMKQLYDLSFLLIEGIWRPHDPQGLLMEGNTQGQWWACRPAGRPVLYAKLRRYLFSIQLSGTPVLYTRDMTHTAFDVTELYHYFRKRWSDHTALLEKQTLNLPQLAAKPSLTRRWASEIEGVGVKFGMEAERLFKTPIALASSEEIEWLSIRGIGVQTAKDIVRQIQGIRKPRR